MSAPLIVLGSANSSGYTAAVVARLRARLSQDSIVVDLNATAIGPFTYKRYDRRDGFAEVVEEMLRHDRILFATPVYWYAMSGVMKTFFDRLTDLLHPELNSLGRRLAGRDVWLLATGTDPAMPAGFAEPFRLTAEYFGMHWRGAGYVMIRRDAEAGEPDMTEADRLAEELNADTLARS